MRTLTAADVISLWEMGHRRSSMDQAVSVLAAAHPEASREQLWSLTLGQRNAHLLAMRELLFGSELEAFSECLNCGKPLEFSLSSDLIREASQHNVTEADFNLTVAGYSLQFRPLDSLDLKAASACADVESARRLLAKRCVLDQEEVRVDELPEAVIEQLAAKLSECDPQAELLLELKCPACESAWQAAFDVAAFVYGEIAAHARRLLREVHALARAYAWSEADILSMSAQRRLHYLEMLE